MGRKRVTEIFPFLLPLRQWQRINWVHHKMKHDENKYSIEINNKDLEFEVFQDQSTLINPNTGMDIKYQYNKVDNLKLASKTMNGLLIKPGEIFSFNYLVKNAEKFGKYKDGLVDADDKLIAAKGGGICQLSNTLFWIFLNGDFTIVERHSHGKMDFPYPEDGIPEGTDATISEGWLDLQVKNDTEFTYQLKVEFDDEVMKVILLSDRKPDYTYEIVPKDGYYYRNSEGVFRKLKVYKEKKSIISGEVVSEEFLYENCCEIGYPVPPNEIREG